MMQKRFLSLLIGALFFFTLGSHSASAQTSAPDPFPIYDAIRDNVEFWKQVYSRYTSREMIFHDSDSLMLVYGMKKFPANVNPWSRQAQRLTRDDKEYYRDILLKFSHGMTPVTEDEKRIYNLFPAGTTAQSFRAFAGNIRAQLGQADRFREGVIRSGAFMDHIKEVFTSHALPLDLVYLPHVESSFDYKAYSKMGAAGMWQFMRSTGRLYMKVNYVIDERRDPITSTTAAAKLLKYNFNTLQSWPLAMTAYNHGLAGMQRAVRKLGTNDYMTVFNEHDGRRFGFASRNFYSEFLAAREVASNYKNYFGDLNIQKPLKYEEVVVAATVDLNTMIDHFNISRDEFTNLNLALRPPAYRRGRTLPKNYPIRLPYNPDANYPELLASLNRRTVTTPSATDLAAQELEWIQVQQGDTLWSISQQLQVSAEALKDVNELDGSRILIGQILKIPSGTKLPAERPVVAAASKPIEPTRLAMNDSLPVVVRASKAEMLDKDWDNLMMTNVPAEALQEKPVAGPIQGPTLREWHGSLAVRDIRGVAAEKSGKITLEAEETLGHFADWLSVPTQQIRLLNGFAFDYQVRIGQNLRVPLAKVTPEELEQKRMEYHQGLQEDFNANFRIDGVSEYQIKRGDTIWQLSKDELDLPIWLLRDYNPDRNIFNLQPGDTIVYPIVVPLRG